MAFFLHLNFPLTCVKGKQTKLREGLIVIMVLFEEENKTTLISRDRPQMMSIFHSF